MGRPCRKEGLDGRSDCFEPANFVQCVQAPYRVRNERVGFVPGVTRQYCADHAPNAGCLLRVENDVLQFTRVPPFNKRAERVDAAPQWHVVDALPVHRFTGKLSQQRSHGEISRAKGNRHAGREHGVQEFTGVAEQRVAGAMQFLDVGGVSPDMAHGHQEGGIPDQGGDVGLGSNQRPQRGLALGLGNIEKAGFCHAADRRAAVCERDHPIPDIAPLGMDGDADLVAVGHAGRQGILYVREKGRAQRHAGRCLKVQQAGQHASESAGIQDEPGVHGVGVTGFGLDLKHRRVAGLHGAHAVAEAYVRALIGRAVDQDLVKGGTFDLVGRSPAIGVFVAEVKSGGLVAMDKIRAVLVLETGLDHGAQHAGLLQIRHALRQQALADRETRKMLPFEHEHLLPSLSQQGGSDGSGGARANDGYVHGFRMIEWILFLDHCRFELLLLFTESG
uniref:Uncharacterized protein n=1 Tax=Ralstonia solanacearum TaxID=305 RepID=A0A0S4UYL0_RALSL|nr:conserved protein of unknown function [Ralstonia solanacearum]